MIRFNGEKKKFFLLTTPPSHLLFHKDRPVDRPVKLFQHILVSYDAGERRVVNTVRGNLKYVRVNQTRRKHFRTSIQGQTQQTRE